MMIKMSDIVFEGRLDTSVTWHVTWLAARDSSKQNNCNLKHSFCNIMVSAFDRQVASENTDD